MFLHLGENVVIPQKEVIAILDIESVNSIDSNKFMRISDEEGFVKRINKEKPKSIVLTERDKKSIIYLSPISSVTLVKRSDFKREMNSLINLKPGK
ncbi:extracellular matrix regulator RemB [Clostridium cylindrosporum]|uniref:DUF370 domain-containing protein n=1 Tax=Clostridium cylindrosporum DSM 605 TaxID=1121307 RepID=A0A0J8D767_CLOCY|nr:extracellular matrix/biofilm biosynthesis regulator RemA family protein [Clostridium cylindrosporum]KMT21737.1 hypothetical protein CLCY_3c00040 [Clostridium cylindrosporum DSM 605]